MDRRCHSLNAILLGLGLGFLLGGPGWSGFIVSGLEFTVPILLGALFPDLDTVIGRHRKTLHNLPVLIAFIAFPLVLGNLHHVWIGILTHYVLDMTGSKRGLALLYPYDKEYSLPVGVRAGSRYGTVVALAVTASQLAVVYAATLAVA